MKPLIAISSCRRDVRNGMEQAVRDTWARDADRLGIEYKFFLGKGNKIEHADQVILNVADDYHSLTQKTVGSHIWAVANGFTHVFQCFTDTYIHIERLLKCGFENYEYMGNNEEGPLVAHGGPGYWTGPKATRIISVTDVNRWNPRCEDWWVAFTLQEMRVPLHKDPRFSLGPSMKQLGPHLDNDIITIHLSEATNKYDKSWMYKAHEYINTPAPVIIEPEVIDSEDPSAA